MASIALGPLSRRRGGAIIWDTVFAAIPVQPFTGEIDHFAAKIDAEAQQAGRKIPFADLLISVTALHFGYAIGTRNLRHFRMIPGSSVIQL